MSEQHPDDHRDDPDVSARSVHALPCGALVDDLLEQVADGGATERTPHQAQCVHCQAALAELAALWAPVLELADEPVVAPHRVRSAIKSQIDRLVEDIWYTLQLTEDGSIRVAARTVAVLAREAAGRVSGVHAALGRTTDAKIARLVYRATRAHRHPRAAVGVLGRTAVVDLALAVSPDRDVRGVAREVQKRVIAELRDGIGLKTVTVNVTVDDILQ